MYIIYIPISYVYPSGFSKMGTPMDPHITGKMLHLIGDLALVMSSLQHKTCIYIYIYVSKIGYTPNSPQIHWFITCFPCNCISWPHGSHTELFSAQSMICMPETAMFGSCRKPQSKLTTAGGFLKLFQVMLKQSFSKAKLRSGNQEEQTYQILR